MSRFIVSCIEEVNEKEVCDVLIVGRGGGLIEELWVFNEEIVVWVIFVFYILIILVVGYEMDFMISDFVVDIRVVILIGVVEIVVLYIIDLIEWIKIVEVRMIRVM